MYNLNVNMGATTHHNLLSLGLDAGCTTPKTPEILNSLIAMSNPFDGYNAQNRNAGRPRQAACPPGTSDSSSSGSPMGSPESPPSVQHTCSQLIKEGLKLTIQTKRRHNGQDATDASDDRRPLKMARSGGEVSPHLLDDADDDEYDDLFSPGAGLTAEDEERRRRRRERNKVAATKCRLKKRERTVNLVQESEILENQNLDLKGQIQELETQRRRLMDMLSMHRPSCQKGAPPQQQPPPPVQQNGFQYPEYAAPNASYGAPTPHEPAAPQYTHYADACNYSGGGYAASDNGCMV